MKTLALIIVGFFGIKQIFADTTYPTVANAPAFCSQPTSSDSRCWDEKTRLSYEAKLPKVNSELESHRKEEQRKKEMSLKQDKEALENYTPSAEFRKLLLARKELDLKKVNTILNLSKQEEKISIEMTDYVRKLFRLLEEHEIQESAESREKAPRARIKLSLLKTQNPLLKYLNDNLTDFVLGWDEPSGTPFVASTEERLKTIASTPEGSREIFLRKLHEVGVVANSLCFEDELGFCSDYASQPEQVVARIKALLEQYSRKNELKKDLTEFLDSYIKKLKSSRDKGNTNGFDYPLEASVTFDRVKSAFNLMIAKLEHLRAEIK